MGTKNVTQEKQHQEYLKLYKKILIEVEEMYGKRLNKLKFGTIIYNGSEPGLDYTRYFNAVPRENKVDIRLSIGALNNRTKGIFQLSHEVVHLLSPLNSSDEQITNNLEEGAAVYFSKVYTKRETGDEANFNAPNTKTGYLYAYKLVEQLLILDPQSIKMLREKQPYFTKVVEGDFEKAGIKIDKNFVAELIANFYENRSIDAIEDKSKKV